MNGDYVALGALIISLLGFLVVVIKSTSNKELFLSLKDAIKELKNAIEKNTQMQQDNFFDFKEHQSQSSRTHNELHEVHKEVTDLGIEVRSYHKDMASKFESINKNISEIKSNTINCKKVSFNG